VVTGGVVLAAQHRHQADSVLVVAGLDEIVDDLGHVLAIGGEGGLLTALAQ
jgi:hypothetical protein